ncbi:hypothetical protein [Defluviitalea phaphyphila]|uniref:hypothetical protein n=1 Tax=Defluviitalea phaphyphila TaxID=1473580 RepID=UPI000731AE0D|nr:hypothetical protein [Defluviitalea phaphyphila]
MNIKINNNRFIQFLSLHINQFNNFDISIKKYMIMHWMGGFLLIYTIILPIYMNRLGIEINNE